MIKVSIILPTYNGVRYIERAIESVLAQSYLDWELLVIDDGSKDGTEKVIKEFVAKDSKVIYLKNDNNLGIQRTLNRGLKEAKGEYIAHIDDDDEWIDKDKLKKQVEFLEKNNDYVLVGTGVVVVDEKGLEQVRYLFPETDIEIRSKLLSKNCFIHSGVIFKKESILKLGGYNEEEKSKHIEDYDLWLKIGLIGKFYNLPIYGTKFTSRKNSISSNNKLEQFKKDLILIRKYKNKYPRYFQALIFSYSRIFLLKIFNLIPSNLIKNKIFKFYKEF